MTQTEPAQQPRPPSLVDSLDRSRRAYCAGVGELPAVRRERHLRPEPGRAHARGDARGRPRLEERPYLGRHPQGCGRRHRLGPAGDLYPVRRRRPDRHLGDERHAGRDGVLCARRAEPRLLLSLRLHRLRAGGDQHRQLVDGGRHHRPRADGRGRRDGPLACRHGRSGDLGRLFRRQDFAAVRHREPRRGRRGRPAVRSHPRLAGDLDTSAPASPSSVSGCSAARATSTPRHPGGDRRALRGHGVGIRSAAPGGGALGPARAALPRDPGRRARRRRVGRPAAAGARAATCGQARTAGLDRAAQGRLGGACDRLCLFRAAIPTWTRCSRAAAWTACSTPSG